MRKLRQWEIKAKEIKPAQGYIMASMWQNWDSPSGCIAAESGLLPAVLGCVSFVQVFNETQRLEAAEVWLF